MLNKTDIFNKGYTTVMSSYSMLFFSNNKIFAYLIFLVSFFNPYTGIAGFVSTLIAVIAAYTIGFDSYQVNSGIYTYSSLLVGMGMGTFYEFNSSFWILLFIASLISVLLSAAFIYRLGRSNLPVLSMAFVFTFWIVVLSSNEFSAIDLTQRNIYWLNEMYAEGGSTLVKFMQELEQLSMPDAVSGFLRSVSAIIFQSNIAAGIVLSFGLLLYSRIAFSLMIIGYAIAMLFISLMGGFPGGINYYNVGTNFMLVATALGGFYIIPSIRSYLWAIITVPISYLLVIALGKITYTWGLPVFSLPFCFTVLLFLYCLRLRKSGGKLVLTPVQYYSPENNLYRYINGKERLQTSFYQPLSLPFMGEWMVSQGHNGSITHKADWSEALDFVILDDEMKTYKMPGKKLEHFYCYDKPVTAPADGIVEEIIDNIEDNEIGENNTQQNWGNTIIIRHSDGLYSKLSHLRKNSFRVQKGARVNRGEVLAHCGNSGRSPEPHLHFQLQATPYVGSKTLLYPIAYFLNRKNGSTELKTFNTPEEGNFISNIQVNTQLQKAFNFQPGYMIKVQAKGFATEEWEVCTSIYNETYFHCKAKNAFAYFINNRSAFYFTNYFGKRNTLLFYFYQAAYKVIFTSEKNIISKDKFPLNIAGKNMLKWLQDLLAPFRIFMRIDYLFRIKNEEALSGDTAGAFNSEEYISIFGKKEKIFNAEVRTQNGSLESFNIFFRNKTINAVCHT